MALSNTIYNTFIKRNFIFVGTIFVSAFAFEIIFDKTTDRIWNGINKGRQWKDIRHRYVQEE
ncbi:ubiquinol-cytochrome C reductase [Terfezia boudieri ATCC MYA-4762]|uniref:Complex III subunit 9 n=1 Tax=Terfezia boudieri ATCC MYA-4762 TaxID=1051890 RepID=A0A3N4LLX3_9PEZI|nr:ubiquinol-cytochrome C reductase [Terfezia boudieri ATCC MYA-4762]